MLSKRIEKDTKFSKDILDELLFWLKSDPDYLAGDEEERMARLMNNGWDHVINFIPAKEGDEDSFPSYIWDYDAIEKLSDDEVKYLFTDYLKLFEGYYYADIVEHRDAFYVIGAAAHEYGNFTKTLDNLEQLQKIKDRAVTLINFVWENNESLLPIFQNQNKLDEIFKNSDFVPEICETEREVLEAIDDFLWDLKDSHSRNVREFRYKSDEKINDVLSKLKEQLNIETQSQGGQ